jgi:hypothetical protein
MEYNSAFKGSTGFQYQYKLVIRLFMKHNFISQIKCRVGEETRAVKQSWNKVKVKCTLVQALRLCTGHMAHTGE